MHASDFIIYALAAGLTISACRRVVAGEMPVVAGRLLPPRVRPTLVFPTLTGYLTHLIYRD